MLFPPDPLLLAVYILILAMQRRYPHQLAMGSHHYVVALDDATVAKLFFGDAQSDIATEAMAMQYANDINDLVVKWVRTDFAEEWEADILVMERLYAWDYRSYEVGKRQLWLEAFEYELVQLHDAGWVHRDLCSGPGNNLQHFDNILLTQQGLRLVDTGQALLRGLIDDVFFERYAAAELEDLKLFKKLFLGR
jgi:hypothetical protein